MDKLKQAATPIYLRRFPLPDNRGGDTTYSIRLQHTAKHLNSEYQTIKKHYKKLPQACLKQP